MQPTPVTEHVALLDILRGVAIFGMFTVNMSADIWWGKSYVYADLALADFTTMVLVDLFSHGKFVTIFSFLFGVGFFVQAQRKLSRGEPLTWFWCRRLLALSFIGVSACLLSLPAWILIDYALFGVALLLFYRWEATPILVAGLVLILAAKLFGTNWFANLTSGTESLQSLNVREHGTLAEIARHTAGQLTEAFFDWRYILKNLDIPGLMLIGLYVGRRGAIWDRVVQTRMARRMLPWLLSVGFAGCAFWVAMEDFGVMDPASRLQRVLTSLAAWPLGMPVLGLGYVAAMTLLIDRPAWSRLLTRFAPIGRMALTNYLFTGFVAAFLSLSWGLGLYGEILPAVGVALTIALLPLQMWASRWWLAHFAFGPVEWLWRAATYGQLPTMRRRSETSP